MKSTIPKKIPPFFRDPKNPRVFQRPKKIPFGQNFRPKIIPRNHPPVSKMCVGAPGALRVDFLKPEGENLGIFYNVTKTYALYFRLPVERPLASPVRSTATTAETRTT